MATTNPRVRFTRCDAGWNLFTGSRLLGWIVREDGVYKAFRVTAGAPLELLGERPNRNSAAWILVNANEAAKAARAEARKNA